MQPLIPVVGAGLSSGNGPIIGYKEGDFSATSGNLVYNSTIRHVDCSMLVKGARYVNCQHLRHTLRCGRAHKKRLLKFPPPRRHMPTWLPKITDGSVGSWIRKSVVSRQLSSMTQRVWPGDDIAPDHCERRRDSEPLAEQEHWITSGKLSKWFRASFSRKLVPALFLVVLQQTQQ